MSAALKRDLEKARELMGQYKTRAISLRQRISKAIGMIDNAVLENPDLKPHLERLRQTLEGEDDIN